MGKLIRSGDKEYMRMAMLKHEETFKEQVCELHRLYRIQKMLMKNMEANKGSELIQRGWNLKNAINSTQNGHHKGAQKRPNLKFEFDLERPSLEEIAESDSDDFPEIIDETEIELTLGPSSYNRKKVETSLTSDSAHSLSSSSTGSSLIHKTRCRTHHMSLKSREGLHGGLTSLVHQVPHSSGIRNGYDIEEQSRQERSKHPSWLFQVLSLSIT